MFGSRKKGEKVRFQKRWESPNRADLVWLFWVLLCMQWAAPQVVLSLG